MCAIISPFYGCENANFDNPPSLEEIEAKLTSQKVFTEYLTLLTTIKSEKFVRPGVEFDQNLARNLSSVNSINEFKTVAKPYITNPDEFIGTMNVIFAKKNEIRQEVPELENLTAEDQEKVVARATQRIAQGLPSFSQNLSGRVAGPCEDQRRSDEQTCQEGALVAAASCGALAPTLLGALACGLFVVAADIVCYRDAERSYEICRGN